MTSIRVLLAETVRALEGADIFYGHGTSTPHDEAAFLLLEGLGLAPDADLDALGHKVLSETEAAHIRDLTQRRISTRKPAPYLLGKAYMHGLPFIIDERALIPRSFIGELLLDEDGFAPPGMPRRVRRILDLCTGCGCLAIIAAYAFEEAQVDAVDLSPGALELAHANVRLHGLEDCITLYEGDLFSPLPGHDYDLIITNPPYVDAPGMAELPPEYRHEPAMALAAGADGLEITRRIIAEAPRFLAPGGGILAEVGRCGPALEEAYPDLPFLWLETEISSYEVFWLTQKQLRP